MIYVTPTQDMLVKPGQHVSVDGRVYHPYLAQWGKYWDVSKPPSAWARATTKIIRAWL